MSGQRRDPRRLQAPLVAGGAVVLVVACVVEVVLLVAMGVARARSGDIGRLYWSAYLLGVAIAVGFLVWADARRR